MEAAIRPPLDPELLPGYLAAVALIELTPGPNMGYLAVVSARSGLRAGAATVAGVTLGLMAYMLVAVAGLAETILRIGWLYAALRWAGVAYLAWLAAETWRGGGRRAETDPHPPAGRGRFFLRGLVANLLNPKAAVFYIAVLPGFTNPAFGSLARQALFLGLFHVGVSIAVHGGVVVAAGGARGRLSGRWPGGRRVLDRGFGASLLAIAAWLAWETWRGG